MSTPKTMNHIIHDAVRRDLERLTVALGNVSGGDKERASALHRAYGNLRHELTRHHEGEDQWVWPMLSKVGVDPHLLATMESEHHAMAEALAHTAAAMDQFAASGSAADASGARESAIWTRGAVEEHFAHEEQDLEPALRPHLESPEWKAVEKKLRRQPPRVAGRFFAWLTDGMCDEDRAALHSYVPAPVVAILSKGFGRRYTKEIAGAWTQGAGA